MAFLAFLGWVPILAFALYRSEERSTKIWLIFCIVLNLTAALVGFLSGDGDKFAAFERMWGGGETAYHAD